MKKHTKSILILTLLLLGALALGACSPVETVATETSVPAAAAATEEPTAAPMEAAAPMGNAAAPMGNAENHAHGADGEHGAAAGMAGEHGATPGAANENGATPGMTGNYGAAGGHGAGGQGCADEAAMQEITPAGELTQDEIDTMTFMREEEKLARDVYLTLYEQWGSPVFQNISRSEQHHMDSVKSLLDAYGVADPVTDDTVGVFTNPDLQALYDQLVEQGSTSLAEAFKVGATIEEIDILDLQDGLAQTEDPNITMVYTNLMNGSYHHLQAFTGQWTAQTGQEYEPQLLSPELFAEIMAMPRGGGH